MENYLDTQASHQGRVIQARRTFFGDGCLPEGLLAQQVLRSWERSQEAGLSPQRHALSGTIVTARELDHARDRSRRLIEHAQSLMTHVYEQIRNSGSMVILADAQGLLLHSVGDPDFLDRASQAVLQPGASWHETQRGTNAIGTVLVEGEPLEVSGAEHFLDGNAFLTCSAAPLHDPQGQLIGVLDISGDYRAYQRHSLGLVRVSAQMIEKTMFEADFGREILVAFHPRPEYVGSLAEGLLAFSPEGRVVGVNQSALGLLGLRRSQVTRLEWSMLFETPLPSLLDRVRRDPMTLTSLLTPHGERLYVRVRGELPPLSVRVSHASEAPAPRRSKPVASGVVTLDTLSTGDPRLQAAIDKTRRVLGRDIPVMIQGESGAGKEMFAKAFHNSGPRADGPFVALNCAAIPESLIESELFGYQGGAFTGARKEGAIGKIQQAHGGTLFLDEIGDMPLNLQARLLRVLQERCVTPIGSNKTIQVDISLICATHRRLRDEVEKGRFRDDLYYRLNGLSVTLPALRERQDLCELVSRLIQAEAGANSGLSLSPGVRQAFLRYAWPGNIRQLHNVIRVAIALLDEGECEIAEHHLPDDLLEDMAAGQSAQLACADPLPLRAPEPVQSAFAVRMPVASVPAGNPVGGVAVAPSASTSLEDIERQAILATLQAVGGNISAAARKLGVSRNTLYRKLGKG